MFGEAFFVFLHFRVFGEFPLEGSDEEQAFRNFAAEWRLRSGFSSAAACGDDLLIGDRRRGLVLGVGGDFNGGQAGSGGGFGEGFAGFDGFEDGGAGGFGSGLEGGGQGVGGQFFA